MSEIQKVSSHWPELPSMDEWADSCSTLHMWTQIAGKIRLELSPWINHSWGSTLYVSSRGLTTSPIPYKDINFEIEFDFVDHKFEVRTSEGGYGSFKLEPMTVADFYKKTMALISKLGIEVTILARPVEVEIATPFEVDTQHNSYDADIVNRYWRALVQVDRVFSIFRAGFIGKSSPSHFFWGAFDLAVTRFSGRTAPKHPGGAPNCADWVMEEAYSHELSSAGFWPGAGLGEAAFYSYIYPEPQGFRTEKVEPAGAYYHEDLGEFILPYKVVQAAEDSQSTLLDFLHSTYEAAAKNASWNRSGLERDFKKKKI
jgi:hypothetical protein